MAKKWQPISIAGSMGPRNTKKKRKIPKAERAILAPKRAKITGGGAYSMSGWTPGADVGGHLGQAAGTFLPFIGAKRGRKVGAAAGHLLGTLFGQGDYLGNDAIISTNSIINPASKVPPIMSGSAAHGGVVFRRREYLGDIVSSSSANTFKIQTFVVNPGQSGTFPWLATVAENFEQYRIRGLVFEFVSLSADATASVATGLGYVAMATQYDVLDPVFTTKQALENYDMSQSCKPSRNQIHGVECAPKQSTLSELYIRTAAPIAGSDIRMYDFANFSIATSAPGTSVTLGELWVSYDIELFKPKIPDTIGGNTLSAVYYNTSVTNGTTPLGSSSTSSQIYGNMALSVNTSTNVVSFVGPPGSVYMIQMWWLGTSAAITSPLISSGAFVNLGFYNLAGIGGSANFESPNNGATSTALAMTRFFQISQNTNPGTASSFTVGTAGTIPTNSTVQIVIARLDHTVEVVGPGN